MRDEMEKIRNLMLDTGNGQKIPLNYVAEVCSAIITIIDEAKVAPLLEALHRMDKETEQLGLRAFVWNIEQTI